jgi:hypothetical protein
MATHQARRGFVAFTWCASAEHTHDAATHKSASRQGQPWRLTCFCRVPVITCDKRGAFAQGSTLVEARLRAKADATKQSSFLACCDVWSGNCEQLVAELDQQHRYLEI